MSSSPTIRWLGVAGIELEIDRMTLLIDPFLTRIPLHRILGTVEPDHRQIESKIHSAGAILVTHSHWDHLFDVAEISRKYGSVVYGSQNTCRILEKQGIPQKQLCQVKTGDQIHLPSLDITLLSGNHVRTPLDHWLNAPLSPNLRLPIRPIDYHKDEVITYHIATDGLSLMHGDANSPADILVINPYQSNDFFETRLKTIHPRLVIPIHWENFMLPSAQPIEPMFEPLSIKFPWVKKVDLDRFRQKIEIHCPETRVFIPEMFTTYGINDIIQLDQGSDSVQEG